MAKEIRPTEKEIEYVNKWYGIKKAKEMADELGICLNRVYNLCQFLKKKSLNVEIELNEKQEQIILSGMLGDGNLRPNGKKNYFYRESHAKGEIQYCKFKCDILSNCITTKGFHLTDKRDGQMGFSTITSPSFIKYARMTRYQIISNLNPFGAILYLLDDGWARDCGYCLGACLFSEDEVKALADKFNLLFDTKCVIRKNAVIYFKSKDMPNLLKWFILYIPYHLDIYKKKLEKLVKKYMG